MKIANRIKDSRFFRTLLALAERHVLPRLEGSFSPQKVVRTFEEKLYEPRAALDIALIRFIIFGVFVYKLLCRDFSNVALAPVELFDIHPAKTFSPSQGFYILGGRPLVDLATFHWLHWFLPIPSASFIASLQWTAIASCVTVIFCGRGPKNIFAITAFSLICYLWGYIWRTSGAEDAIFLPQGMMLFYCFSRHREALIIGPNRAPLGEYSRENGWMFSMCLLIFVNYYFLAGVNKLVHINIIQWFTFDGLEALIVHLKAQQLGFYRAFAPGAEIFQHLHWLDIVAVPMTYTSHLLIPVIYYRRDLIWRFWAFYTLFHYMAWMMNLFFFSNFLAWFCFFPLYNCILRLKGRGAARAAG